MSDNKLYSKVELRGYGKYYGEIIEADLVKINGNIITVRVLNENQAESYIDEYCLTNGFSFIHTVEQYPPEYSGYQLNFNSLVFDKTIKDREA